MFNSLYLTYDDLFLGSYKVHIILGLILGPESQGKMFCLNIIFQIKELSQSSTVSMDFNFWFSYGFISVVKWNIILEWNYLSDRMV